MKGRWNYLPECLLYLVVSPSCDLPQTAVVNFQKGCMLKDAEGIVIIGNIFEMQVYLHTVPCVV